MWSVFVDQIKRLLKTRIKEHTTDINKKNGTLSVISNHRLEQKHKFNWEDIKILDIEPSYKKKIL